MAKYYVTYNAEVFFDIEVEAESENEAALLAEERYEKMVEDGTICDAIHSLQNAEIERIYKEK